MGMTTSQQGRREFFRDLARNVAVAGMALLGGVMAHRHRSGVGIASRQTCVARRSCRDCRKLGGCGVPRARSAREVLARRAASREG